MSHSRFQAARKLLIFWTFFIGLGAVAVAKILFFITNTSLNLCL